MKTETKVQYAIKPDAQPFDEIRIKVVPRFKESELSGDEWRISAQIDFCRNENVIVSTQLRNIETAAGMLYGELMKAIDDGHAYYAGDGVHCDQEGCSKKGVYLYRIKQDYCAGPGNCGQKKELYTGYHRLFCEKHSHRGDQSLDDRDDNYELISLV